MKNKLIAGGLLIIIGAVFIILGIPFFAMEDRFSSEHFGSTMIHLLLLIGGATFLIGGILSIVTKNAAGEDYQEKVWPQPNHGNEGPEDTADVTTEKPEEDL